MPSRIDIPDETVRSWAHSYTHELVSMRDIATKIGRSPNFVRDRLSAIGVTFDKRPRMSIKAKGRLSPRKGYRLTDDERRAVSQRTKGNKFCLGRKLSDESKQRMSDAMKRRHARWIEEGRVDPAAAKKSAQARTRMKRMLRSVLRSSNEKKSERTEHALGYSKQRLIEHIERKFMPGMSWDRRESFSIDHRVPIAEFLRQGVTDPKLICSLINLRPLPPRDNRVKSDKYDGDFAADLQAIVAFNADLKRRQEIVL